MIIFGTKQEQCFLQHLQEPYFLERNKNNPFWKWERAVLKFQKYLRVHHYLATADIVNNCGYYYILWYFVIYGTYSRFPIESMNSDPFGNCLPGTELLKSPFRIEFSMRSLLRCLRHCRDPWSDLQPCGRRCRSSRDSLNSMKHL